MNTITFLYLVITTAYAVIADVEVKGSFRCTFNEDTATIELWDWDPLDDDEKLASKKVSVNGSFHLVNGVEGVWFYLQPYIVIKHRCNSCNEETVIQYRLGDVDTSRLIDFGVINLDNLESTRCLKEL